MSERMKNILMNLLGVIAFVAFAAMCSETMPGQEGDNWVVFAFKMAVCMAVIGGCVWGINKLDKMIPRDKR